MPGGKTESRVPSMTVRRLRPISRLYVSVRLTLRLSVPSALEIRTASLATFYVWLLREGLCREAWSWAVGHSTREAQRAPELVASRHDAGPFVLDTN